MYIFYLWLFVKKNNNKTIKKKKGILFKKKTINLNYKNNLVKDKKKKINS